MSRKDLGVKLGISENMVAAYEQDASHPNSKMLLKMSYVFNVSIDYLLENEKEFKTIHSDINTSSYAVNDRCIKEFKKLKERE